VSDETYGRMMADVVIELASIERRIKEHERALESLRSLHRVVQAQAQRIANEPLDTTAL
jgi:hypothetical protein